MAREKGKRRSIRERERERRSRVGTGIRAEEEGTQRGSGPRKRVGRHKKNHKLVEESKKPRNKHDRIHLACQQTRKDKVDPVVRLLQQVTTSNNKLKLLLSLPCFSYCPVVSVSQC